MKIKNAEICVTNKDRFGESDLDKCTILCDFNIFNQDWTPPPDIHPRMFFDNKSDDYKKVFGSCLTITNCTFNGPDVDNPPPILMYGNCVLPENWNNVEVQNE